ncbi:hypothetical protein EYF80_027194 [Liparis tanakae]|uniref:Uncharacterized protein n=1 Tax=Liparis tanakae TaxID=230148 RepID=A0A4Z2HBE9_9TELE|nr:hypothetical protein EYF80_027194 [Liparis tanakae]
MLSEAPEPKRGLAPESETSEPSLCLTWDRELTLCSDAPESRRPRCKGLWLLSEAPESSRALKPHSKHSAAHIPSAMASSLERPALQKQPELERSASRYTEQTKDGYGFPLSFLNESTQPDSTSSHSFKMTYNRTAAQHQRFHNALAPTSTAEESHSRGEISRERQEYFGIWKRNQREAEHKERLKHKREAEVRRDSRRRP